MNKIFYVQKESSYFHGIFGIFDSAEEAIERADKLAAMDRDDHHSWCVREFKEIDLSKEKFERQLKLDDPIDYCWSEKKDPIMYISGKNK